MARTSGERTLCIHATRGDLQDLHEDLALMLQLVRLAQKQFDDGSLPVSSDKPIFLARPTIPVHGSDRGEHDQPAPPTYIYLTREAVLKDFSAKPIGPRDSQAVEGEVGGDDTDGDEQGREERGQDDTEQVEDIDPQFTDAEDEGEE